MGERNQFKASTPTTPCSPSLEPCKQASGTKVRWEQGSADSDHCLHQAAQSTACRARHHPERGGNRGRKQPLPLCPSKIFIPSIVATKQRPFNLDERLITQDLNDLSCCGWRREAKRSERRFSQAPLSVSRRRKPA